MFSFLMFMSTLGVISSSSWMMTWVYLELSTFFFIPLGIIYSDRNPSSVSAFMVYFVIQAFSSSIYFLSTTLLSVVKSLGSELGYVVLISLLIKLGSFPFFPWMFHVISSMGWETFHVFMTFAKLTPLMMLMLLPSWVMEKVMPLFMMGVFVSLLSFSNFSIRVFLMISSVVHLNWMLISLIKSKTIFVFMVIMYMITFSILYLILSSMKVNGKLSEIFNVSHNHWMSLIMMVSSLSMWGAPPLLMFTPKVLLISEVIESGGISLGIFLIIFSVIPIYLYLTMSIPLLINNSKSQSLFEPITSNQMNTSILCCMISVIFGLAIWLFSTQ